MVSRYGYFEGLNIFVTCLGFQNVLIIFFVGRIKTKPVLLSTAEN
jgi:hypothetical protein